MKSFVLFFAFLALFASAFAQQQQYDADVQQQYAALYAQQLANANQGGEVSPQWLLPFPPFFHPFIPPQFPHLPSLPPMPSPFPFPHPSSPKAPSHPASPSPPSKPASPSPPSKPASPSPPSHSSSPKPPSLPDLSPCADDLHSFLTSHKIAPLSKGCCSALEKVQIPFIKAFATQQCSGGSPPSA